MVGQVAYSWASQVMKSLEHNIITCGFIILLGNDITHFISIDTIINSSSTLIPVVQRKYAVIMQI